jgi:hypothetical protein
LKKDQLGEKRDNSLSPTRQHVTIRQSIIWHRGLSRRSHDALATGNWQLRTETPAAPCAVFSAAQY